MQNSTMDMIMIMFQERMRITKLDGVKSKAYRYYGGR